MVQIMQIAGKLPLTCSASLELLDTDRTIHSPTSTTYVFSSIGIFLEFLFVFTAGDGAGHEGGLRVGVQVETVLDH